MVIGMVFGVDFFFNKVLQPHQRQRIEMLIDPGKRPAGQGLNVTQSKIALGSGGWLGKGFPRHPNQIRLRSSEQSTDFIFCTVGEEWGWVGCLVVIALYMTLPLAHPAGGRAPKIGVWAHLRLLRGQHPVRALHRNPGMTMGLMPVVGILLPFFLSYGGSSLWWVAQQSALHALSLDAHRKQDLLR
ncbi:MAG: FtsW/RodA/SpoVE family cell cycle protein [Hymenobacter sp.]